MARYTSQKEFEFNKKQEYRAVIPDAGASVALELWNGATWTTDSLSPITSPKRVYTFGLLVRLTPTGGGFWVDEGF